MLLLNESECGRDEPVLYRPAWWRPYVVVFLSNCDSCKALAAVEPQPGKNRAESGHAPQPVEHIRQTVALLLVAVASAVGGAIVALILRGP